MLSAWEIERMGLADRTYQAPKSTTYHKFKIIKDLKQK